MWSLPDGARLDPCNDFGSTKNCAGGNYIAGMTHRGVDFGGRAGTPVISATYGEVVEAYANACSGYEIKIRTPIQVKTLGSETVYLLYAHAKPTDDMRPSKTVKPGDLVGHIIPLLGTTCYGSRTHVHLEMRVGDDRNRYTNPHQFWADGVGKVTCFRDGTLVPQDKMVAPIRCD